MLADVEKACFTWRGEGADDGHVDGVLVVDVDVNLGDADSSRRCNEFQLQTGNECSDSWNGEVQSVCLLASSRNRPMKMLFPIYNHSHPPFFLFYVFFSNRRRRRNT